VRDTRTLIGIITDSAATLSERHDAFGELVARFQDMAYACAYAALGDPQLAEDIAQEAFVSTWRNLGQLREPDAFPGWFRRVLQTECNRLTRGKRVRIVPLEAGASVPSAEANPQADLERHELKKVVLTAVMSLPQNERTVTLLSYLDGRSHKEIGDFLGVPTTTVAKRLYSARGRLKAGLVSALKEDFEMGRPSRNASFAEKVRAGIFDDYVGRYKYELRPDLVVEIKREGDGLVSESAGQRNELFAPGESERELQAKEFDGRGEFVRDGRGRVTHFVYFEFGREMGRALKIGQDT